LYRLGKRKGFGEMMIATKFEPMDNWLPPGYFVPPGLEEALIQTGTPAGAGYNIEHLKKVDMSQLSSEQEWEQVITGGRKEAPSTFSEVDEIRGGQQIPYNLLSQHSIPDKSIADAVEALIGAYLISSGPKGALLVMQWLGLKVMKNEEGRDDPEDPVWHWLPPPRSPLIVDPEEGQEQLTKLYIGSGLEEFEEDILGYSFKDKAFLVQAFTHNSYFDNQVTDCYQRLEFLGDAGLDFLITRHLYDDPAKHSPGVLTDLRSALVNNTLFAKLAVKYKFNCYLNVLTQDLFRVIKKFVEKVQSDRSRKETDLNLFISEGECENLEDVEVPKALGDIFESVAGAIYLDSGMSLDAVWKVYFRMMKLEIEYFRKNVPKSPIRELLEMEPQNATFGKPELISGRKVRVVVEVFGEGKFPGIGRNKRLAKCTAAKRALRYLKQKRRENN